MQEQGGPEIWLRQIRRERVGVHRKVVVGGEGCHGWVELGQDLVARAATDRDEG